MDGDGFDYGAWGSQPSAPRGLDLNSQVPAPEEFSGLQQYDDYLQGGGLPPYRPSRVGAGGPRPTPAAPYARQLQFGGSSSAAAGRGGGNGGIFHGGPSSGAPGRLPQRANSASAAADRRPQRGNMASRGSSGQRGAPHPRAPRAPSTRGTPFGNDDAAMEDDVEELASSGGPVVSHPSRAQWNDANNASLLELCIEQRRAGTYNGSQMSSGGYQAVVDGLLARRGLVYTRLQVKNQIGILKNTHAFWRYLQTHTGLGRRPDGSIDADSDFWQTHTEKKPYLKNETSQNVIAICDFDMRFTFVLSGWPGSAHDMRVFKDAITTHHHKFPHPPPGKYYVVDAGYPNRPGYLSPYRCTRYHVEQWQNGPPLQGMKETFNHAHAKVRNVIERNFGVLKMKFRILLNMPRFPEDKQTRIIVACMALHNFIRESRIADRDFDACDADENYNPMPSSSSSAWPEDEPLVEDVNMNAFRDGLAHALFHGV